MKTKHYLAGVVLATMMTTGPALAQVNLSSETANAAGTTGTVGLTLGEVAAQEGIANIQVATGQTLTNSLQNAAEGKTDITATPFILPFLMSRGLGPYAALGAEKGAELSSNLQVLYTYNLGTFLLYAYDSANFGGWDDVAGKTIFNGPPRGGALTNARGIIKLVTGLNDGDGYTGLQVNWDQAVKTIMDGSADATVLPSSFPDSRLTQAVASGGMTVWSVPREIFEGEAMQKYGRAPGSGIIDIPLDRAVVPQGVTVVSDDDRFRGIATMGGDVVHKDMDEELAYRLTKAVLDNLDTFYAKTPFMPNILLGEVENTPTTGMCGAMPLKYHPGAVRAWEEAGFTVPDCAKP